MTEAPRGCQGSTCQGRPSPPNVTCPCSWRAMAGPMPRTRCRPCSDRNGPLADRSATMRLASAGPMKGRRSISAAGARSTSTMRKEVGAGSPGDRPATLPRRERSTRAEGGASAIPADRCPGGRAPIGVRSTRTGAEGGPGHPACRRPRVWGRNSGSGVGLGAPWREWMTVKRRPTSSGRHVHRRRRRAGPGRSGSRAATAFERRPGDPSVTRRSRGCAPPRVRAGGVRRCRGGRRRRGRGGRGGPGRACGEAAALSAEGRYPRRACRTETVRRALRVCVGLS